MQNYGVGKVEAINNGDTILIKVGEIYFETTEDGEVKGEVEVIPDTTPEEIEGKGTEEKPFIIMSIEDLVLFSKRVNEGTSYNGEYVELGKTLDFNSNLSYVNPNTTEYDTYLGGDGTVGLKEQLTIGLGFKPIGWGKSWEEIISFGGMFDGKNNSIKNIKIDIEGYAGVFGSAASATIQNIIVTGKINGTNSTGGIVGVNQKSNMINCKNDAEVSSKSNAGGITGTLNLNSNNFFSNCINYGRVSSESNSGGIIGYINQGTSNIKYCVNSGVVIGSSAGGIIGQQKGGESYINSCCSTEGARIEGFDGTGSLGGVMGLAYGPTNIYNSVNLGTLSQGNYVRSVLWGVI